MERVRVELKRATEKSRYEGAFKHSGQAPQNIDMARSVRPNDKPKKGRLVADHLASSILLADGSGT